MNHRLKLIVAVLCLGTTAFLSACEGTAPEEVQRLEEKVTSLEQRVETLESNLQQTRLDLAARDNEVAKLQEDLRNVATILNKATVRLDRAERR